MRIDELKRIAKENDYEYSKYSITHIFTRENTDNYIRINSLFENGIWISNIYWCDGKDIKMIKAAIEFAETPPEDREEEKKFYLEHKWENKKFTRKEIEEIIEKFDVNWKDFAVVEVKE